MTCFSSFLGHHQNDGLITSCWLWWKQSHKKRSSDKKNFSISAHIFFKFVEFYFGKGFLLKKAIFITKIIVKFFQLIQNGNFYILWPKNFLRVWIFNKPLKLKSSKKSKKQAQSLQIWCHILEKNFLSIDSGIGNNVLPWRFGGFCFRKKFYS